MCRKFLMGLCILWTPDYMWSHHMSDYNLLTACYFTILDKSLVSVGFELNPINSKCNQIVRLSVLPVKVVYDAPTINSLLDMFVPPSPIKLQTMSSGISATLASLRTQTRAGLEHAIDQRKIMDIDVSLCSPIIHIPQDGVMTTNANTIVINLGSLNVKSDMKYNVPNVRVSSRIRSPYFIIMDFWPH